MKQQIFREMRNLFPKDIPRHSKTAQQSPLIYLVKPSMERL
jgi:hypothetical protein